MDITTPNLSWLEAALIHLKGTAVNIADLAVGSGDKAKWIVENILTHPESKLTCIDPFMKNSKFDISMYEDICQLPKTTVSVGEVSDVLRIALPLPTYDVVCMDCKKKPAESLQDLVLIFPMVKKHGMFIMEGVTAYTPVVQTFIEVYGSELKVVTSPTSQSGVIAIKIST
jgi:hypothetical protein